MQHPERSEDQEWMWHPTRPKLQEWFDQKLREFAEVENQNSGLTTDKWLVEYVHDGIS